MGNNQKTQLLAYGCMVSPSNFQDNTKLIYVIIVNKNNKDYYKIRHTKFYLIILY